MNTKTKSTLAILTLTLLSAPVRTEDKDITWLLNEADVPADFDAGIRKPKMEAITKVARDLGVVLGYNQTIAENKGIIATVAAEYDIVFNFSTQMIRTPTGALVRPPIVTRYGEASRLSGDRKFLENRDVFYRITAPAELVLRVPTWRDMVILPKRPVPDIEPTDRPTNADLRKAWRQGAQEGWDIGVKIGNRTVKRALRDLKETFVGVVTYHKLVELGMIRELHIKETERGIIADATSLSIGGRRVVISRDMRFNTAANEWEPIVVRGSREKGGDNE